MVIMNLKLSYICLMILISVSAYGQDGLELSQEESREVILKVLSKYKNPMSYYPLRRDIFLPTEEEIAKDELNKSYPKGARSLGSVVFISSKDTTYYREPFVDANGDLLDLFRLSKRNYPSLKSNSQYYRNRQEAYVSRSATYSRFYLFNTTYGRGL